MRLESQATAPHWTVTACVAMIVALCALPADVVAAPPVFRRHALNAESTYSACAAIDVNRDGKLDVVCGGWWYEAPKWTRHFVRDVEVIRGRYDDYSNLPMDVNGDGWPDLVSANYRSGKIYWIEHPGESLGPWTTHEIAAPGPSETARLVDIDGDGRLDVLPNGTTFAAWWELLHENAGPGWPGFQWVRHDLPAQLAAHGIGFGDIDGDGRGDLVGPRGWFQAPEDRRSGTWQQQAEFQLHHDACVPVLVFDVDGDGDNDVVWSRAHSTGLYWYEQVRQDHAAGGSRRWVLHAIDTSWSQAHALLFGDLDNDGRPEVVAGKRYLGHDGRDLGEYDPMIIAAYSFERDTKTWRRNVISVGGAAGFGLDPKLVDLDGDGDLDIIGPGRSGLFWFENLLISSATEAEAASPQWPAADYDDHTAVLTYKNDEGLRAVTSPAEWGIRRAHILASMQQVMGSLPDPSRRVPLDMRVLDEVKTDQYIRRKISFAAEPGDRVPAYLLVPIGLKGKAPAMLCLHQTTAIGKDEPAGVGGDPSLHYAHELAERGYVCLVPDYPSFGEYKYDFRKAEGAYASGSMKAVWNNLRAIDLLESLPDVDRDRIGCIGHSLGAHNALFTAVFDQRIKAVVSSCGFSAFHDDDLPSWTGERYMPRIRDVYGNDPDRVPFDFHEVVAALAPRAVFINAPLGDRDFDVAGVRKVIQSASQVDQLLGAEDRLLAVYPDCPHAFPADVRERAYAWLGRMLR